MLLTLTANSLRPMLQSGKRGGLSLQDLPAYTFETLGLHGLNLSTDLLAGKGRSELEKLREAADKARCACLLLVEPQPLALGDLDDAVANAALDRVLRVIQAAHLLGCNSAAITPIGEDDEHVQDMTVESLKRAMSSAEKLELNLLIAPGEGFTSSPERVTDLMKKVGGFRLGTFPDFETAARSNNPVAYLRRLTPYAAVVSATTIEFEGEGDEMDLDAPPPVHVPYDLQPLVEAVLSVGYDGSLAVDYRGKGDPTIGVIRSREALEMALMGEAESA